MFTIRRIDTDILIISNKYVEELRALPKLNAIEAHVKVGVSFVDLLFALPII